MAKKYNTELTKEQLSARGRIAALTRWANEDPAASAARGQAGLQRKFYEATDPTLPEAERQRRAHAAFRAHMTRLAFERSKRASQSATAGGDAA